MLCEPATHLDHAPACRPIRKLIPPIWSALGPANNALMRTTVVPTLASMGVAMNVVPTHSEITVDMRNLPGDEDGAPRRFMLHALRAAGVAVAAAPGDAREGLRGRVQRAARGLWRRVSGGAAPAEVTLEELPGAFPPAKVRSQCTAHCCPDAFLPSSSDAPSSTSACSIDLELSLRVLKKNAH